MATLPAEIILQIVEHATFANNFRWRNAQQSRDLFSLSLVSKLLFNIVQPHLYSSIHVFGDDKAFQLFLRSLKDNPSLAFQCRSLVVRGTGRRCIIDCQWLFDLFGLFPNVERISLDISLAPLSQSQTRTLCQNHKNKFPCSLSKLTQITFCSRPEPVYLLFCHLGITKLDHVSVAFGLDPEILSNRDFRYIKTRHVEITRGGCDPRLLPFWTTFRPTQELSLATSSFGLDFCTRMTPFSLHIGFDSLKKLIVTLDWDLGTLDLNLWAFLENTKLEHLVIQECDPNMAIDGKVGESLIQVLPSSIVEFTVMNIQGRRENNWVYAPGLNQRGLVDYSITERVLLDPLDSNEERITVIENWSKPRNI